MKKLPINREKWNRGSSEDSGLRNGAGKMCCLGFDALNEGSTIEEINGAGMPSQLHIEIKGITIQRKLNPDLYIDTYIAKELATVNDNSQISDREREERIIELFAKVDPPREVVFIN